MPNITTRAGKSATLTHNELDANFTRTVNPQTATYAILASDNRAVIECSHATTPFTVTMPTVAAAAGEDTGDFECTVFNINAAVVSVDGNGTEPINGSTDLITLKQWDSVTLKLNNAGTGWNAVARVGDVGAIDATTVTAETFNATGDTSAGDGAALGYTATEGAIITGQGSTSDVTIKNDADATVINIPTGTDTAEFGGNVVSDTDSTDDLGTDSVRWANLYVDDITATDMQLTVQRVKDTHAGYASSSTTTPIDDTLPLYNEGLDTTLSAAITPTSATNELEIECTIHAGAALSGASIIVALFQDASGTDPAIACSFGHVAENGQRMTIPLKHIMAAGTTSATTFTVRVGASSGAVYLNGSTGGRELGGGLISSIVITEIKA